MKKYWFKRKKYGYGWSPATTEGWVVTISFIAVIMYIGTIAENDPVAFIQYLILAIVILILICVKTGEKPKWRWGKN